MEEHLVTGYKIVYNTQDGENKSVKEVQAFDLPDYVRKAIDQYFDWLEDEVLNDNIQKVILLCWTFCHATIYIMVHDTGTLGNINAT